MKWLSVMLSHFYYKGGNTMTEKQKRFCIEYLIDLNATQAAIRAGYSKKSAYSTGCENLRKTEVKKYIAEQLERLKSEKIAGVQEILEYLTSVMRGKQKEQVPLLVGEGIQKLVQKDISAKDRIKAAELIGKCYGLFAEKLELQGKATVQIIDDIPENDINS